MPMGECCNEGDLDIIPEYLHHIHCREEDAETILQPPLHLPMYENHHIWGACWCMMPVGNGMIQSLPRPGRSCVDWYALFYS